MQSYRLVIESDGKVRIPNGQPGRIVTVLMEESSQANPVELALPISSMTPAERERLKAKFLQRGNHIRSRSRDQLPISEAELYGDDGLPR